MSRQALMQRRAWLYLFPLFLALTTRLHHLGTRSLWIDEAFSVWMARHPGRDIWTWSVRIDQHPPLYYWMLHVWGQRGGWGESNVRALSLLAGLLTLVPLMSTAHALAGRNAALWAGVLLALSPFQIAYAQEARMYTWVTLAVAVALWGFVRLWMQPGDRMGTVALALGTAGALWLHNVAFLFILTLGVWWGFWYGWGRIRGYTSGKNIVHGAVEDAHGAMRARLRAFAGALVLAGILWVPWVVPLVHQVQGVLHRFWIPYPTWRTLPDALHTFHWGVAMPPGALFWLGDVLWFAVALKGMEQLCRRYHTRLSSLLVGVMLLPLFIGLIVSLWRPIFIPRVFLWVTVPYLLLTAVGLATLPRQWGHIGYVFPLVLVALLLFSWGHYDVGYPKEDWRGAVDYVRARAQKDDVILFNASWAQIPFDFYAERRGFSVEEHGLPVDLFARGELEPVMTPADIPLLLQRVRAKNRVWLVYSHAWYTDPEGIIPQVLGAEMTPIEEKRFVGIRVVLYSRGSETKE